MITACANSATEERRVACGGAPQRHAGRGIGFQVGSFQVKQYVAARRAQLASQPKDNPFVFHGRRRCPISEHLLGWDEACERAGLPGLLFHDLRRSAVRNMKRARVQDVVAMSISAHRTRAVSSTATTS